MQRLLRPTLLLGLALALSPPLLAERAWTVMVYMMADNDLEESAVADLDEMAAAELGKDCSLVVLADRGGLYSSAGAGGLPSWSGARRLISSGGRLRQIGDWGAADLGSGATVARFVADSITAFPAERYALIFWDHGGAWTGFGVDESASSSLEIVELERGLEDGLDKAGIAKLDLLGFDACLMSDFETISHLSPFARYYLACEELEPGHGWDYRSLSLLGKRPGASALELGAALADGFMSQARAEKGEGRAMLALVELAKFGALEKAVEDFALAARDGISSFAPALGRSVGGALAFGKAGSPEQDANLVDLGSFASAAAKECPALAELRDGILAALRAAVPVLRKGAFLADATGISIYFPNRAKLYKEAYGSEGHPAWIAFLDAYFASGTRSRAASPPPRFDARDNAGSLFLRDGKLWLEGRLLTGSASRIVDATFSYGIVDGEDTILLGDEEASMDPKTGMVACAWDGMVLSLSQGKRRTWGYLSLSQTEAGSSLYEIPFAYFKGGSIAAGGWEYSWLDLVVDGDGEVESSTLYKESDDGMVSELHPARGSKLVPLVEVVSADGESEQAMTEDWGFDARDWESIEFDFEELEKGTSVYLELYVADSADEGDWVGAEGEWP